MICCGVLALLNSGAGRAQAVQLPDVEVLGATPVPGTDLPREHIPANVHTIDAATIRRSHSISLPELMTSRLPGVNVNEAQGNPFQMDVNYRGFTASPLLGTPQGLSVYQDGVRLNEPFGDIVNWDLIPMFAIDSLTLMPGSNPLFGLNTLGGALVLHTKSGDTSPGFEAAAAAGSFGRRKLDFAHGAKAGNTHVFGALSGFGEDGWRDHSPSRVRSAFGKVGQHLGGLEWDLALTYARTNLIGNGLLAESLLTARREQIYTRPDRTRNALVMAALNASYAISDADRLSAVAYQRRNRTATLNGDINDEFDDAPDAPGVENRTNTKQKGEGLTLQWTHLTTRHQSTFGAAYDRSRSRFVQTEAEGDLDSTRAVVATEAAEVDAQLRGRTRTASVYLTHTHTLLENLQLTVSARYNVTRVQTVDELNGAALPNLNADYTYRKLNPALGATWQVTRALGFYANASQGSRAPSPIELGCADPAQPCTLPNALQSDPFLKQVVARTLEAGARGTLPLASARWNAAIFQSENRDDILFVGTSASASRGFFQNFGKTRRRGVELGLSGRSGPFELQTSYSFVRASFESPACVVSQSNSSAGTAPGCAAEQIQVLPGNRIPGLPEHSFKLNATARPADKWSVGSTLTAYSDQFVRGNENNAHQPGATFSGSGRLPGYALLDLYTTYDLGGSWQLFAKLTNVFDRGYASAGQLGRNAFDAGGAFIADADDWRPEQFVGPGAPRAGWIGVRYRMRGR